MGSYFNNLSEQLLDSYDAHDHVIVECMVDPIELDLDTAIPIGLIVNELLTNALKYAFPMDSTGRIEISMKEMDNNVLNLVVSDNGIGKTTILPSNLGFGSQLILLLTKQLRGTVHEEVTNGTRVSFELNRANSNI